ncbi:hypothetical protein BH11BAC7_BH11BAC7_24740 [soil metagenome]
MKKQDNDKSSVNKKEDITNSKNKENENLPGYPHYPESEDIMNTEKEKFAIDIENPEKPFVVDGVISKESTNDNLLRQGNSADVTNEDLRNLGSEELAMDMGADEQLKERIFPVDMEGKDLIVPGAELDDKQEDIGSEDEENNLYSSSDN